MKTVEQQPIKLRWEYHDVTRRETVSRRTRKEKNEERREKKRREREKETQSKPEVVESFPLVRKKGK